jgi:hypothetical protein
MRQSFMRFAAAYLIGIFWYAPIPAMATDLTCDFAPYPSLLWSTCEASNFARQSEAPAEQTNPWFQLRLSQQNVTNLGTWTARALSDPSWLGLPSGNSAATPVGATWQGPFAGDPFRYPEAQGADGSGFYTTVADVIPVVFYDRQCTRLAGRVWAPKQTPPGRRVPVVLFINGSVQATEPGYWWLAEALVQAGYAVMTFDPRGQSRSDWQSPDGQQGSNANLQVFWEEGVDAIDFLHSTPARPYPHNPACATAYPTVTTAFNPVWDRIDPTRVGVAGHSAGAIAVSVLQGFGSPSADPWPGMMDTSNPVSAAVALDSLIAPDGSSFVPVDSSLLPAVVANAVVQAGTQGNLPRFGPRVPSMTIDADYSLDQPVPFVLPPDPELHKGTFRLWQTAGVPIFTLTHQGTTHLDFPTAFGVPATSWCPDPASGVCEGGWARPSITYYAIAWFDRWLKEPGEAGYTDADARLLHDGGPQGAAKMSFHFRSARDFPDRSGARQHCESIRTGC